MTLNDINNIMYGYDSREIEKRLNDIFNGYLGSDSGDCPEELQQNHYLITRIVEVFRQMDNDTGVTCSQ